VRIISRSAILEFSGRHEDAYVPLMNWYRITKRAEWRDLVDVRRDFSHADIVGRRTVFNIKGNKYRLIARVNFRAQRVFILKILTHAEYAKGRWRNEGDTAIQ
jgi:mRNA interferase HigB